MSQRKRHFALIAAAGMGSRMRAHLPKQYLPLLGKPLLQYSIDTFSKSTFVDHTYLLLHPKDNALEESCSKGIMSLPPNVSFLRCGGHTRRDSVLQGLYSIKEKVSENDWILVHDAARPGLTLEKLDEFILLVNKHPVGGLLAMPVSDTVKKQKSGVVSTVSRDGLWLAQTPQMFRYQDLVKALETYPNVTDESGAMEAMGHSPLLVEGDFENMKITKSNDLNMMELFLKAKK